MAVNILQGTQEQVDKQKEACTLGHNGCEETQNFIYMVLYYICIVYTEQKYKKGRVISLVHQNIIMVEDVHSAFLVFYICLCSWHLINKVFGLLASDSLHFVSKCRPPSFCLFIRNERWANHPPLTDDPAAGLQAVIL